MDWKCLPVCIGSMPHLRAQQAVDVMLRHIKQIPYWPQLPALGFEENMYAQFATKLPGIRIDADGKRIYVDLSRYDPERFYTAVLSDDLNYFAYPRTSFHGFYEIMEEWQLPSTTLALKGQVTGPVSMGLQVVDQEGKSVIYDETYSEIVRKNLNMMVRWQERALRQKFPKVMMFLDEPSLSLIGTPFAAISKDQVIRWIDDVFEGVTSVKGLHCCGNTDWPMVLAAKIDILSFDAYNYGYTISLYPEEVKAFIDRGGQIAWGIVPNDEETLRSETVASLVERLERGMGALSAKGIPVQMLFNRSIITPQCGLGPLNDEELAEDALHLLKSVSEEMRRRFGLV